MRSETFSVILWCWHNRQTDATQLRVVRVDTAEEVHLSDGTFLLRISTDEHGQVERCFIRHLTSGRDAYIQGGPKLRTFIKACLLQSNEPLPESEQTEEDLSDSKGDAPDSRPESAPSNGSGEGINK